MKYTPPSSVKGLTFDELVSRAKVSETTLSPADVERMLQSFQARLNLEAGAQAIASQGGSATQLAGDGARVSKLTPVGKVLLGGAGLAAVAAFIYGATIGSPATPLGAALPATDSRVPVTAHAADSTLNADPAVGAATLTGRDAAGTGAMAARDIEDVNAVAPKATRPRSSNAVQARTTRVAPSAAVSPQVEALPSAVVSTAASSPASSAPAVAVTPAPALDTSLTQLERAERELRSGNTSAALATLALPVVPSLSSRVDALRAVALCQSGQTAAGRRLGTRHLVGNPRSPYEQRLQRACGDL